MVKTFLFGVAFKVYRFLSAHLFPRLPAQTRVRVITLIYRLGLRFFPQWVRSDAAPLQTINLRIPTTRAKPLPNWALDEMRALSQFEPLLCAANQWQLTVACADTPDYSLPGYIYAHLGNSFNRHFAHIIVVPWLKRGGADLGILHWARALAAISDGNDVLVIATETANSPWREKLPPSVTFLDFGNVAKELSLHERSVVLGRLLVQHPPETLHIINSLAGWLTIERYGAAIRAKSKIFASVYCDDFAVDGVPRGYGRTALPKAWNHLDRVFSDNTVYPQRLHLELGLPLELFKTIYFPAPVGSAADLYSANSNCVLWASRLDRQKRPDLLYAIAAQMPELKFYVYGESLMDDGKKWRRKLKSLPNVTLAGGFDGFGAIADCGPQYFVFLYTSAWDGLPNVLLEATAAGLPIVTSSAGGISDLITLESGYPVNDFSDISAYVSSLRELHRSPEEGMKRLNYAKKILIDRHTFETFATTVKNEIFNDS
jgi:glycosyltransferase involved in cell wall biosynthesis